MPDEDIDARTPARSFAALARELAHMKPETLKILIVTDAWEPQVNGVVRTLKSTRRELEALGHTVDMITPLEFRTVPCPTYPEIRLSLLPSARVRRRRARPQRGSARPSRRARTSARPAARPRS